jgi:hypothetical protein
MSDKMTKPQHLVALLILIPSIPFALPLSVLTTAFRWLSEACEWLYDFVGAPFLWLHRAWLIRCERVNRERRS